jgi:hypothetical protein
MNRRYKEVPKAPDFMQPNYNVGNKPSDLGGKYTSDNNKHLMHGLIVGGGSAVVLNIMNYNKWYLLGPIIGFGTYEVMTLMETRKENTINNTVDRFTGRINTLPNNPTPINSNNNNNINEDFQLFGSIYGHQAYY